MLTFATRGPDGAAARSRTAWVAGILAARRDELAIRDPDVAAFILVSAIEAIAHRAALFAPERLRDPRLIHETPAMVTRYLGVAEAGARFALAAG